MSENSGGRNYKSLRREQNRRGALLRARRARDSAARVRATAAKQVKKNQVLAYLLPGNSKAHVARLNLAGRGILHILPPEQRKQTATRQLIPRAFQTTQSLCLGNNELSSLAGIEVFPELVSLSLANNNLCDADEFKKLKRLSRLRSLYVSGNPVCHAYPNLRAFLLTTIPSLQSIDGIAVSASERKLSQQLLETEKSLLHIILHNSRRELFLQDAIKRTALHGALIAHVFDRISWLNAGHLRLCRAAFDAFDIERAFRRLEPVIEHAVLGRNSLSAKEICCSTRRQIARSMMKAKLSHRGKQGENGQLTESLIQLTSSTLASIIAEQQQTLAQLQQHLLQVRRAVQQCFDRVSLRASSAVVANARRENLQKAMNVRARVELTAHLRSPARARSSNGEDKRASPRKQSSDTQSTTASERRGESAASTHMRARQSSKTEPRSRSSCSSCTQVSEINKRLHERLIEFQEVNQSNVNSAKTMIDELRSQNENLQAELSMARKTVSSLERQLCQISALRDTERKGVAAAEAAEFRMQQLRDENDQLRAWLHAKTQDLNAAAQTISRVTQRQGESESTALQAKETPPTDENLQTSAVELQQEVRLLRRLNESFKMQLGLARKRLEERNEIDWLDTSLLSESYARFQLRRDSLTLLHFFKRWRRARLLHLRGLSMYDAFKQRHIAEGRYITPGSPFGLCAENSDLWLQSYKFRHEMLVARNAVVTWSHVAASSLRFEKVTNVISSKRVSSVLRFVFSAWSQRYRKRESYRQELLNKAVKFFSRRRFTEMVGQWKLWRRSACGLTEERTQQLSRLKQGQTVRLWQQMCAKSQRKRKFRDTMHHLHSLVKQQSLNWWRNLTRILAAENVLAAHSEQTTVSSLFRLWRDLFTSRRVAREQLTLKRLQSTFSLQQTMFHRWRRALQERLEHRSKVTKALEHYFLQLQRRVFCTYRNWTHLQRQRRQTTAKEIVRVWHKLIKSARRREAGEACVRQIAANSRRHIIRAAWINWRKEQQRRGLLSAVEKRLEDSRNCELLCMHFLRWYGKTADKRATRLSVMLEKSDNRYEQKSLLSKQLVHQVKRLEALVTHKSQSAQRTKAACQQLKAELCSARIDTNSHKKALERFREMADEQRRTSGDQIHELRMRMAELLQQSASQKQRLCCNREFVDAVHTAVERQLTPAISKSKQIETDSAELEDDTLKVLTGSDIGETHSDGEHTATANFDAQVNDDYAYDTSDTSVPGVYDDTSDIACDESVERMQFDVCVDLDQSIATV
ncbi:MAG: hypothetical protein MHM6MM_004817 [Cercozoa sp. M6MM]